MKKVFTVLVSAILAIAMAISMVACGGSGTGPLDTPQNFKIDATGKYSFDEVSGADRYSLNIYSADVYDAETHTLAEGASATYSATLRQASGTVSGLDSIPWNSYIAVLQAKPASGSEREDSAETTATFAKGGKLSTPEFYVFAGTLMNMGSGEGGENPPAPDGEGGNPAAPGEEGGNPAAPGGEGGTPAGPGGMDSGNEGEPPASGGEGGNPAGPGGMDSGNEGESTPKLYIVINTDNYLKNAFATEAVFSFAYEVYADEAMTDLLYEEDCFADNIVPAGFTLYSGNEATIDISDFWTEEYTTWYVRVKANGNAERNVTESDWTELFEITFNNTSTVPFDYGFGRESNVGNFG